MRAIFHRRRRAQAALAVVTGLLLLAVVATTSLAPAAQDRRLQRRANAVGVKIDNLAYHPRTLSIGRGTKVVFTNRDGVTHTATRRGSFSTGHIRPGHSVSVRFGRSGVYAYHCLIHSFMHGKIVVR
jgi:plastocyanin